MSNNAHILPNDNNSILPTLTRKAELNIIITNKDGTPDHLAINIYYDSLRSWYNPMKQYQADGNVLHIKKLKTQGIYSRAEQLATIHGVSKETIRKKLVKLEKLRLIQRSFKHKFHSAVNTYNQRIIYVLKDTPHFFNPHGIDREEIKELIPQTNAEYIAEKYNVIFAPQTKQNKLLRTKGGIHTLEDTKELIEPFSKEKDRSNESNFSVNAYSLVQSKSNSFNNSNFLIQSETSNLVETEQVVKEEPKPKATLHILKPNKTRPNKRRKPTKAQQKAGKAKLLRFRQYTQPQDLTYHYPLTAEDASELQSKSTRYFSLNAQNQILLSMSNKPSLQGHRFASKAQFMAYMGKVLLYEMRDAAKTANDNFYIKANKSEEQLAERTRLAAQEKFLNEIEQQAILHVSPEDQLKAKLANTLAASKAYKLLSGLSKFQLAGDTMEVHFNSHIDFTEHDKNVILSQVQAVYGNVEVVNFIIQKTSLKASNSNIQQLDCKSEYYASQQYEPLQLPRGTWGDILKQLIAKYGIDTYRNWFSKLTANVNDNIGIIELNASSSMIEDWISSKYRDAIEQIVADMGLELMGLR